MRPMGWGSETQLTSALLWVPDEFRSCTYKKPCLFQNFWDCVIAGKGLWTGTCLLLRCHTFEIYLSLSDWAIRQNVLWEENSPCHPLSLPMGHYEGDSDLILLAWVPWLSFQSSDSLDASGGAHWRAGVGSHTSLLIQHFKSWASWHPKGNPFLLLIPNPTKASLNLWGPLLSKCWPAGEMLSWSTKSATC